MKEVSWEMKLGIVLIALSISIFTMKHIVLGNPENTYSYLFNALGFLPVNVFLVTVVLNKLLSVRSKRDKMEKLNMVIGTFFSEVGTGLLTVLSDHDSNLDEIRDGLVIGTDWTEIDFMRQETRLKTYTYEVDVSSINLAELREYLSARRDFLLRLLENPVLLEHESFTGVLRPVFHLVEELDRRKDFKELPSSDYEHLAGDINRVYGLLVHQWLDYMKYLQYSYPYLFSLAIRTNPFDETASAVVQ